MPQTLHYPDVTAPPGWTHGPHSTQIRFLPPGEPSDSPCAALYLSPLVARHPALPALEQLLARAIATERDARLILTDFREPSAVTAHSGLAGLCVEIACTIRGTQIAERRLYVMYADSLCYYGITYIAVPRVFAQHLEAFWGTAKSKVPFKGRAVSAAEQAAKVIGHYND